MKFFSSYIRQTLLLPCGVFLLMVLGLSTLAQAQDAAKVIVIGGHDDSLIVVPTGEKQSLDFSATVNHDPAVSQECTLDGPTWTWTSSVETLTANGPAANLSYEFDTAGTYTISVSAKATYKTTWHTENGNVAGDDIVVTGDPKTYNVKAVKKIWSTGPGIGVVWDSGTKQQAKDLAGNPIFDGRLTLPQDQTVTPAAPARIVVKPGTILPCSVEGATDMDKAWMDINGDGVEQDDEVSYEPDEVKYSWSCPDGTFSDPNQSTTSWTAPQEGGRYILTCNIDDAPKAISTAQGGTRDDQAKPVHVEVTVATSSFTFAHSKVAIGAIGTPEHQSQFTIQIMAGNEPVADYYVGTPEIASGGRGPKDVPSALVEMPTGYTGYTDANGTASGTFTAGSREEPTTLILNEESIATGKQITTQQVWNDLPEGNGSGKQWLYDDWFYYNEGSDITYNMAYQREGNEVGITNHHLEFVTTQLSGGVWDPTAGPDEDGDGFPDGDWVEQTFNKGQAGFDAPVFQSTDPNTPPQPKRSDLVTWDPQIVHSTTGAYKSSQTVALNFYFIVDNVNFDVIDDDAFGIAGDND